MSRTSINVSHVNVRTSIALLLIKLLTLDGIAALLAMFLNTIFLTFGGSIDIPFFNLSLVGMFVVIKMFLTIFIVLQWLSEYYEITGNMVYHRSGVIFKHEEKYPLEHIGLLEVSQGMFGRICNFGTITLYDRRRNKYVDMYLIHNPFRYEKVIESLVPNLDERKHLLREHIIEQDEFDDG